MKLLRLFVIFATMLSAVVASAKDYVLTEGENVFDGFTSAVGVFTAPKDGKVLVEAQEVFTVTYAGKNIEYSWVPGSGMAYVYEVDNVKAGETVTVSSDFVWNSGTRVKISMFSGAVPVEVLSQIPSQGSVFKWNSTGSISVNYNKTITIKSIKFVVGDYTADVDDVHLGSGLGFNVTNALNDALKNGVLNAGDKFQIVVTGLCDAADSKNLYNGDGKFVMEYIAPHPQHGFVKATVGDYQLSYLEPNAYDFLSYYSPQEEDGLFVVEFDGDVKSVGSVVMTMGNLDLDAAGKYHRSALPYTIDGNKLLIDARGTLRTLAILFPAVFEEEAGEGEDVNEGIGAYDTEHVTISVTNVLDVNGNAFRTGLQGSVGSFSFVMNYKEVVDEVYMDGDNKADGDVVKSGEEVSLWISNADVKFDGIMVTYFVTSPDPEDETLTVQEQVTVRVNNMTTTPDPVQGMVLTLTMPDISSAAPGSTVRVALDNAATADGMPHYLYIEFKADGDESAITTVQKDKANVGVYSIGGVKVNEVDAHNGLFIVNGKTMYIK